MSMSFQIAIEPNTYPQRKAFVKDLYPNFDEANFEYDPFVYRDEETGLLYEWKVNIPFNHIVNMSYDRFYAVLSVIDANLVYKTKVDATYGLIVDEIPNFRRKIVKALNSAKTANVAYDGYSTKNVVHGSLSKDEIKEHLENMLDIVTNAQERGFGVFWS